MLKQLGKIKITPTKTLNRTPDDSTCAGASTLCCCSASSEGEYFWGSYSKFVKTHDKAERVGRCELESVFPLFSLRGDIKECEVVLRDIKGTKAEVEGMGWEVEAELAIGIDVVKTSGGEIASIRVGQGVGRRLRSQSIEAFLEVDGIPGDDRIGE
jgi:hypothetical protein